MVFGMAYVSPRRVLRASSVFLRWQVWATTLLCVLAASATLTAQTETGSAQLAAWWPVVLSFGGIFINAGMVWQQLNETKRRVEKHDDDLAALRRDVSETYARKDVIVESLKAVHAELASLREVLAK